MRIIRLATKTVVTCGVGVAIAFNRDTEIDKYKHPPDPLTLKISQEETDEIAMKFVESVEPTALDYSIIKRAIKAYERRGDFNKAAELAKRNGFNYENIILFK